MTTATTTEYTPAETLQVELIRRLDAVRELLPQVRELPRDDRDGWEDDDLFVLAYHCRMIGDRLADYLPNQASLERNAALGIPWAQAMLLRDAGQPVPVE